MRTTIAFLLAFLATSGIATLLNVWPYLRTYRAYQYDGQEMVGFPWTFRQVGGDCFPLVCENYDFHLAYFAADVALALACALAAGYLAARLGRKRPRSP